MAENVVKMSGARAERKSLSGERALGEFLDRNKRLLLCLLAAVVVAIAAYALFFNLSAASVKKNLDKIEVIEYSLLKDADGLDQEALASRRETALSNLKPYLEKGGIAGARADMLAADIYGQKADWKLSKEYWLKAASKRKGSYIESLCGFNAAAACEELGQGDEALGLYEKVASDKNYPDRSRAYFNAGRLKEGKEDYEGAKASYEAISALGYSNDPWGDLAKSRILDLEIAGRLR